MKDKRIVVALGRNAFGETFPEQKKNVKIFPGKKQNRIQHPHYNPLCRDLLYSGSIFPIGNLII